MRHFVLLAASLSVVALQAADPTLLNLVMPDAKVLAGINIQKAKTTQFGQFLLTQIPAGNDLNGFVAATGFDPRQDLTEVLMASNGGPAKNSGLVLARGTFNPATIAAAIDKEGKHTSTTYKGAQLITSTNGKDNGAVAFLSGGNIAIVGDVDSVKGAVDRSTGNNALDPTLAAKVASYAATDAWSVSITSINIPGTSEANNPIGGALKSIQQASGSIVLSSPVQITAEAQAASDQDATSLSDVLKFVAMMVAGQNPATASLVNSLNVTTNHSTINLQLSIPEDQLEQIIKGVNSGSDTKVAKKRIAAHV